jgi:uncharacterized protein YcfL
VEIDGKFAPLEIIVQVVNNERFPLSILFLFYLYDGKDLDISFNCSKNDSIFLEPKKRALIIRDFGLPDSCQFIRNLVLSVALP